MKNIIKVTLLAVAIAIVFIVNYSPSNPKVESNLIKSEGEISFNKEIVSEVNTKPFYKY